jgi:hypothetical protein
MKTKKVLFYLLAGILAGCLPVMSLNPLYDNQTLVFNEKLLDTFEAESATWEFTRAEEPNAYQLIYTAVSKDDPNVLKGLFEARLVNLNGRLFLDIFPRKGPWGDEKDFKKIAWPINAFLMIPTHAFAIIEIAESQLEIGLTDNESFEKIIKAEPNAIEHQFIDGTPVLTSPTKQLQSFVLKCADEALLFTNKNTLTRKTSKPVQDANQTTTPGPDANDMPV